MEMKKVYSLKAVKKGHVASEAARPKVRRHNVRKYRKERGSMCKTRHRKKGIKTKLQLQKDCEAAASYSCQ